MGEGENEKRERKKDSLSSLVYYAATGDGWGKYFFSAQTYILVLDT